ncbi:hypothetical protein IJ090_02130 [Candidatus Saccharibacteria bacterium]|nr:hypothetical protein [Candidatus Saccharibacteria bacterium]
MKKLFTIQIESLIKTLALYVLVDLPQEAWFDSETSDNLGGLFSPEAFQDAVKYESYLSGRILNLDRESMENGVRAIGAYQARYVAAHLPKAKVKKILQSLDLFEPKQKDKKFVRAWQKRWVERADDLYNRLSKALDEPDFREKFTRLEKTKVTESMLKNFPALVRYPARFEFTAEATKIMNQKVIDSQVTPCIADYYVYSFESYEAIVSLLPVAEFLVRESNYAHLIWLAGDYLNIIWRVLPNDELLNARFERVLFNAYWLKINSLWPIVNYPKFKFNRENDELIFNDALGWIMSLTNLDDFCPELCEYLDFLGNFSVADQIASDIPKPVINCAFHRKHKNDAPEKIFAAALNELPEEDALTMFAHPDTPEEAELSVDFLLSGRLDAENVPFFAEKLVNVSHPDKIAPYIINRYVDEFENLVKQFERYNYRERLDYDITVSIFETACDNAVEPDELLALERFADAIRGQKVSGKRRSLTAPRLDRALKLAKANVADFTKARQKLVDFLAY